MQVSERQEPGRSRVPLRADARARERREHRAARRRGGGARRHRQTVRQSPAAMGAACGQHMRTTVVSQGIEPDRARHSDAAVRAEISRRQHDARPGDAGGLGLHHRADRLRLAGRQLSAARRLERLRTPHRIADDVARWARARRAGRRLGRIKRGETEGDAMLRLNDLSVTLDDGTAVVGEADSRDRPGEWVLVAGESGTGKSTLVRAIAGLWPWGGGSVDFQPDRRLFMMPQKPYMPSARCGAPTPIPRAADELDDRGDRRGARQSRARSSDRAHRGGRALGPDAVGRRKAAAGVRAPPAASARHRRARRGDVGARSRRARTS